MLLFFLLPMAKVNTKKKNIIHIFKQSVVSLYEFCLRLYVQKELIFIFCSIILVIISLSGSTHYNKTNFTKYLCKKLKSEKECCLR